VLGFSVANWTMDVFVLIGAFGLLGLPIPWRAVLFAYAAAQVAGSLAPSGGVGFVEGGMIGAFAWPARVGGRHPGHHRLPGHHVLVGAAVGSVMLTILSRRAWVRGQTPGGGGHVAREAKDASSPASS